MTMMNTKPQILRLLEDNRGAYVSGGELAGELSVSRNAIWKAVEALRDEGYSISAITNRGYRLDGGGDILSADGIVAYLKTCDVFTIDVRKSVTSTNTVLRGLAGSLAGEGYVIAAGAQSAGKGRFGRAFHSPAGHGAYFSLLLRPGSRASEAALITSAAAVAAARAIEEVFGVSVGIKWVNDLLVDGKKVCGILTEAEFGMESGRIESAVLGIGINVSEPEDGFPEELENVATALCGKGRVINAGSRCRLIAAALDNFWGYYTNLSERAFLSEYRSRSILPGRDIIVVSGEGGRPARAIGVDDDCGLIVRYEDGSTATLSSGEVSIRL